ALYTPSLHDALPIWIALLDHIGPAAHRVPARIEHEAANGKAQRGELAGLGDEAGNFHGAGAAQPGQRDMGHELASLGRQAGTLQDRKSTRLNSSHVK